MNPWTTAPDDLPRPRTAPRRERTLSACPGDGSGRCTPGRCVHEDAALLRAALQAWVRAGSRAATGT